MPSPNDKGFFLEFNEHFLLAARTISLNRPLVIEEMGEAPLDNKAGLTQVLSTVIPDTAKGPVTIICSVRPAKQFIHLAGDEEARQYAAPAALQTFAKSAYASSGACELAGVQVRNGLPLDGKSGSRWLLAGAPQESLAAIQASLKEWNLTPARIESATLSLIGGVLSEQQFSKSTTPVIVWEVGAEASHLYLISGKGFEAAKHLAFGFDKIVEAVQAEMNLKFKGAAARLFFNEFYDFAEVGPKIAGRVNTALQPALAEIAGGTSPVVLLCIGMTSKQAWFNDCMAKALGLTSWQPNLAGMVRQRGPEICRQHAERRTFARVARPSRNGQLLPRRKAGRRQRLAPGVEPRPARRRGGGARPGEGLRASARPCPVPVAPKAVAPVPVKAAATVAPPPAPKPAPVAPKTVPAAPMARAAPPRGRPGSGSQARSPSSRRRSLPLPSPRRSNSPGNRLPRLRIRALRQPPSQAWPAARPGPHRPAARANARSSPRPRDGPRSRLR